MNNVHCYYGVEFQSDDPERNPWVSTQLFSNRESAHKYGSWGITEGGYYKFRILKFQLQHEHVQD